MAGRGGHGSERIKLDSTLSLKKKRLQGGWSDDHHRVIAKFCLILSQVRTEGSSVETPEKSKSHEYRLGRLYAASDM
jgi:hypothetical protein